MKTLRDVLLVAVLVAVTALSVSPAYGVGWGDEIRAGTGGGAAGGTRGVTYCGPNGEGWIVTGSGARVKVYDAPFFKCDPARSHSGWTTGTTTQFVTRWEVWRFYGTEADPAAGYTVSDIFLPSWTYSGTNTVEAVIYSPHPNDAGAMIGRYPWQASSGTNAHGETFYRTSSSRVYPSGALTTGPPFRNSGISCTGLRSLSDTEIGTYVDASPEAKSELETLAAGWAVRFGADVAAQMANLSSVDPFVFGDGIPCTSGVEFAGTRDGVRPVYGACWIPVERRAIEYSDGRNLWWEFPTRGGHRYDDDKFSYRYSSAPKWYHDSWRDAIYNEVLSRPGNDLYEVPGDPYKSDTDVSSRSSDRAAAAAAAANYARCEDGPTFLLGGLNTPPDDTPPPGSQPPGSSTPPGGASAGTPPSGVPYLIVTVDAPEYFTATGDDDPQTVTVTPSTLRCVGCTPAPSCPDAPEPRLSSLDLEMSIAGSGGYTQYRLLRTVDPRGLGTHSATMVFYTPTTPGQSMHLEASGSGTYVSYDGCHTEVRTIGTQQWEVMVYEPSTHPVTIVWRGTPVPADIGVVFATAVPRFDLR